MIPKLDEDNILSNTIYKASGLTRRIVEWTSKSTGLKASIALPVELWAAIASLLEQGHSHTGAYLYPQSLEAD